MENNDELIKLKIRYDKNLEEIETFLETGKTYKDMESDEFEKEVKLFWKRARVWGQAQNHAIYSEEKLENDFEKYSLMVNRLVMGQD